ncbi:MAG: tRNA (adenosine(37)-N6)-dimethylallyltransferase MiaA [Aphanocapsa sp. GSE-SYN-MK-11-07L]|jgi:tRNA dimethylallyltransferase|nr:tRNA (adenosine(37)-N6)-dimethylallyltransferase MiaA [Aphanocapsa sp. GSE-SYN-MK-11-07L]
MDRPGLIVICGPTATGKSGLAMALAERLETVILSADSRQVYRGFDIGTAKPTALERLQVPHYLIDLCEPTASFTLAQYQQQAKELIANFHQRGQTALLVGGTGLYIQAIAQGLIIPAVAPQPHLRSQLANHGQHQIYQWLQQVDPISARRIHANDHVRTLRALEVYYVTGLTLAQQQGQQPPTYPILSIGLDCPQPERLTARIQQRTAQMLAAGWRQEVEDLITNYGPDLPLFNTLGYQELRQHLAGQISLAEATELIVLHTRQFAKRQRTWFRATSEVLWFDADQSSLLEQVWLQVQMFLDAPRQKSSKNF